MAANTGRKGQMHSYIKWLILAILLVLIFWIVLGRIHNHVFS
ncbi:MAG: hypothetical protein R6U32_03650 [Candidatus Woesearchaeota archaeon]